MAEELKSGSSTLTMLEILGRHCHAIASTITSPDARAISDPEVDARRIRRKLRQVQNTRQRR